jgi:hypothetical protein
MPRGALTIKLLEDTLYGAGAATAAHGDVKLVVVLRHGGRYMRFVKCVGGEA